MIVSIRVILNPLLFLELEKRIIILQILSLIQHGSIFEYLFWHINPQLCFITIWVVWENDFDLITVSPLTFENHLPKFIEFSVYFMPQFLSPVVCHFSIAIRQEGSDKSQFRASGELTFLHFISFNVNSAAYTSELGIEESEVSPLSIYLLFHVLINRLRNKKLSRHRYFLIVHNTT